MLKERKNGEMVRLVDELMAEKTVDVKFKT